MANEVKLQEGHPVDENLRPLKVGGEVSSLEISKIGNGARVQGDLEVVGNIFGNVKDSSLEINEINSTNLSIDDSDTIYLDADSGEIHLLDDGTNKGTIDMTGSHQLAIRTNAGSNVDLILEANGGSGNMRLIADSGVIYIYKAASMFGYFDMTTSSNLGLSAGINYDLTLVASGIGDINLDAGADVVLDAGSGITKFELGGDTDDLCTLTVAANGATTIATADSDGAAGHLTLAPDGHVEFDNCGVGFDKLAGTFGTSAVIGSPNDGTDIDFRLGNKYELILTDDMGVTDLLNLIFPAVTGNFILILVHDPGGGYDIHDGAWKAYAADESLADSILSENGTDGEVRWAGGATPTLSANGRDIDVISIYWDADNQTALAVASLDFAAV